jgi:hypothetical protein
LIDQENSVSFTPTSRRRKMATLGMISPSLTALCRDGSLEEAYKYLDEKPGLAQEKLDYACQTAILAGNSAVVGAFLEKGAAMTHAGFAFACQKESPSIFQHFLNHGWDVNSTAFGGPALR